MLIARFLRLLVAAGVACSAIAATFGTVVPLSGHVSDIALDSRRGLLYAANFTANRIEVISTSDLKVRTPYYVPAQPGSIALSPDGRYLVIAHYGQWTAPATNSPSVTVLDLDSGAKMMVAMAKDDSPLAVAFGGGRLALVVSSKGFKLLDPATGVSQVLLPAVIGSQGLPVPFATFPPEIIKASVGLSGDGRYVVGVANEGIIFKYDSSTGGLLVVGISASPPLGPHMVSVDRSGNNFLVGWALFNDGTVAGSLTLNDRLVLMAQFPYAEGSFNVGGHAFDWARSLIYAQIPEALPAVEEPVTPGQPRTPPQSEEPKEPKVLGPPVLHVVDADNLTVRDRLHLPENLAGRSLLNPDHSIMYSASDSGVIALPVGNLHRAPRVAASREDVLFRGNFCDRRTMTEEIDIVDAGGGNIDFQLSTSMAGVTLSPAFGTTPARVKIFVDPNVYQNLKGTAAGTIEISSRGAINIPVPPRILINTREPDQRGALFNVPGKLVDILPDPVRDRFYIIRQDKNQVLVFNATSFQQLAVLRTGNTPTGLAITSDNRFLLVGNDNSQIANRYDLDQLQQVEPIIFPLGHYPRTIAVSGNAALVTIRCACSTHKIDRVDFEDRIGEPLPTLGIYTNDIPLGTVLAASPTRSTIFAAMEDGGVLLYEALADTFVASRQDFAGLKGAFAALSDQVFVADNHLLNQALVAYGALETGSGSSSGFTVHEGVGIRTTAASPSSPGVMQRVDLANWEAVIRPVKMIEAPLLAEEMETEPVGQIGQTILPFSRTLMVTSNRASFVSLSVSGFMVLPWDFDAWVAKPVIQSIVNLADGTTAIAPGGLVAVRGTDLSRVTLANTEVPVPTTLGETCVTFNNVKAPLLMVSPTQVNGQVPFEVVGNASVVLRTAGGSSDPFPVVISGSAPAVFQNGRAGPETGLATLYRTANNEPVTLANPIHPEDILVIYVTGLGSTTPPVPNGVPAPSSPLAQANVVPSVKLGGVPLEVLYAGLVPGQVGVYQINVYVPLGVPLGMSVPFVIGRPDGDLSFSVRVVK